MESLKDTEWDVLIVGTGLKQSLLALALSRSSLRILHTDHHQYYGGNEAALSLQDADAWCERISSHETSSQSVFSNASIISYQPDDSAKEKLGPSRAYNIALAPQILYTRSTLLPLLVSSGVHEQLEFLAVGSWWIYKSALDGSEPPGRLLRIPSSREDIFSDTQLNIRHKRALVKFLRFIAEYQSEDSLQIWQPHASTPFADFLTTQFNIPEALQDTLLSLTMTRKCSQDVKTEEALARIFRHLTSMNVFGPGFAAVLPKWGGLSEISQVSCRAMAVGGGVYVLNQAVEALHKKDDQWIVSLGNDESISARFIVGSADALPEQDQKSSKQPSTDACIDLTAHSICIVSSPLDSLFPSIAEGVPTPAGAIVVYPSGCLDLSGETTTKRTDPPVHFLVHSSDTGECVPGQCIVYSSTPVNGATTEAVSYAFSMLQKAIDSLLLVLETTQVTPKPRVLWRMRYTQHHNDSSEHNPTNNFFMFSSLSNDLAVDDAILTEVKEAWKTIVGNDANEAEFMKFAKRSNGDEDDD